MSFHGGLLGVTLAIIFYARKHKADLFAFADVIGIVAPQGLFFGRMANFINGELWGRPGFICGVFWAGYGLARIIGELWREPDAHLGYLAGNWLTMGMILSLPLVAFGVWLIMRALKRPPLPA